MMKFPAKTNFTAFKDETLFSIATRICMCSAYPSGPASCKFLHIKNQQIDSFFPVYVPELSEATSIISGCLIHEHSILDFFKPFSPKNIYEEVYSNLSIGKTSSIHNRLGLVANHLPVHSESRYCKNCAFQDVVEVGCAYWHRQHQLPGVTVCSTHNTHLYNYSRSRKNFFLPPNEKREGNDSPPPSRLSLNLAQTCNQLLEGGINLNIDANLLKITYLSALFQKGLASKSHRVKQNELRLSICKFWEELINDRLIGSILKNKQIAPFPANFLYNSKCMHHPIKHILMILFLFENLKDFLQFYESCRVTKDARSQPVQQTQERNNVHSKLNSQTFEMLQNGFSLRKIARTVGASIQSVKKTALKNAFEIDRRPSKIFNHERRCIWRKLYMGRSTHDIAKEFDVSVGSIEQILSTQPILVEVRKKMRFFEKRAREREIISTYIANHRSAARNQILNYCNRAYMWLFKNDQIWLYKNLPSAVPRSARFNRSK